MEGGTGTSASDFSFIQLYDPGTVDSHPKTNSSPTLVWSVECHKVWSVECGVWTPGPLPRGLDPRPLPFRFGVFGPNMMCSPLLFNKIYCFVVDGGCCSTRRA